MHCALGIDTSCYTTSVALAFEDGQIEQARRLLSVPGGERGLQQSKGVFQHVQNLPELLEELMAQCAGAKVSAVCASERPRDVDGSYMPVFTVGAGTARAISAALHVPYFSSDHQHGHVRAALVGTPLLGRRFLGVHLSGGTTELLSVDESLRISLVGGASDITSGQLIDRVGVALGLPFPAGPHLEALAMKGEARAIMPTAIKGALASFSGAEAQAMRMVGTAKPEDIAAEVFSVIARTLAKLIGGAMGREGDVLMAGGVASSKLLQNLLQLRLKKSDCHVKLYWAKGEFAGDNAVGAALTGLHKITRGRKS